jgi:hypothetical protein
MAGTQPKLGKGPKKAKTQPALAAFKKKKPKGGTRSGGTQPKF